MQHVRRKQVCLAGGSRRARDAMMLGVRSEKLFATPHAAVGTISGRAPRRQTRKHTWGDKALTM